MKNLFAKLFVREPTVFTVYDEKGETENTRLDAQIDQEMKNYVPRWEIRQEPTGRYVLFRSNIRARYRTFPERTYDLKYETYERWSEYSLETYETVEDAELIMWRVISPEKYCYDEFGTNTECVE